MKRVLRIVIPLLVIALLALPPWFGRMAEDSFRARAGQGRVADYLDVRVVEYERGWFRSRATVELGLDSSYLALLRAGAEDGDTAAAGAMDALDATTVRLVTDLTHGPVGFGRGPFVGLAGGVMHPEPSDGTLPEWRQRLDVPYLLEVRHRIGLGGTARFELVIPPIDFRDGVRRLTLAGWDAWAEYDPSSRRIAVEAGIETLEVAGDETNLRIESMSADVEGTIAGPSLLLGEGGFHVERISLLRPYEALARTALVGFHATGNTEVSDDGTTLRSSFTYAVDSLVAGDQGLRDAEIRMAALNVDRAAAERWAEITSPAALAGETADGQEVADELSGLIYDLLAAGPVLEVDPARFLYDGEPFRARIRVTTNAPVLPDRDRFELTAPESLGFWSRLFTAEAEVEASRSLARTLVAESQAGAIRAELARRGGSLPEPRIRAMAEQQADAVLTGLVEGGFLTEREDLYATRLTYRDGELTANGRALPIPGA